MHCTGQSIDNYVFKIIPFHRSYIYIYLYVCTRACTRTHVHVCVHVRVCVHVCVYIYAQQHASPAPCCNSNPEHDTPFANTVKNYCQIIFNSAFSDLIFSTALRLYFVKPEA